MEKKAILIVSGISFLLTIGKLGLGFLSGSILIIASSLDSFLDTLTSLFNYAAFHKSKQPPNDNFNYGLEKLEAIAGALNAVLVLGSGGYIIFYSLSKIFNRNMITHINEGIYFMIFSIAVLIGLVIFLNGIVKKSRSLIIKADLINYKTDLANNITVVVTLWLIDFTDLYILDGILGLLMGVYTCFNAIKIGKDSSYILLDRAVDATLLNKIIHILENNRYILGFHELKTRICLNKIFLECHLVFNDNVSLLEAHHYSNNIEENIRNLNKEYSWNILMHLDPYDDSIVTKVKVLKDDTPINYN